MSQKTQYGPRFTGGDHLRPEDGFKYYLHKTMMVNELGNGYGGYLMSNAGKGSSGPSFGPIQYDIGSNNKDGRVLLEKVATQAKNGDGKRFVSDEEIEQMQKHLYKPFNKMSQEEKQIYNRLKPKLDKALSSEIGMQLINQDYPKALDKKINDVNKVINQINIPENKRFLESSMQAKVFIADIGNQYGSVVNEKLKQFLNQTEHDQGVTLPGSKDAHVSPHTVKVRGQLDMEDLKNFRMNTAYGVGLKTKKDPQGLKTHQDAIRRDENIERITAPTRQQDNQKSAEFNTSSNNNPADRLHALIQGFKNDTDGSFAAKALAENADVVANFRAEQQEVLKERSQQQQQEVAQNTPQIQEERSYGGRSFG